ncbi:GSCOCG00009912001-RA-CDS [Cotesia congregata]|nr:GSCOCG00009912001-RA-CDS [Cotesia congregata]
MVANNAAMNGGANRNWSQATFFTATTLPLEPKNLSRTPYQPLTAAMKKPIA